MRGQYGNNSPDAADAASRPSNTPGVASILAVLGGFIARRVLTSPHWLGR